MPPGGEGKVRGRAGRVFNGHRISVWEAKKVPEIDGGDRVHNNVNGHNASKVYT